SSDLLFEALPCADGILPQLVAVRVPIIAEHLNGAGRAIDLECGAALLLNGEAGGDHGERVVAEVQQHLRVVLRFDADLSAVNVAFGNGHARHGHDALGGAEQAGQTREAIDTEVKETTAARLVEPFAPRRAGPAVTGAG